MPLISKDFIRNKLIPRLDIVKVIQQYRSLKLSGGNYKCCCPFHNEKTPSFMVSPARQTYRCFGCGEHGNAIDFVMKYNNTSFVEAVEELARFAGLDIEYDKNAEYDPQKEDRKKGYYKIMDDAAFYFTRCLQQNPEAMAYFKEKRGLSDEIIVKARLGFAPDSYDYVEKEIVKNADEYAKAVECGLQKDTFDEGRHRKYAFFRNRVMFPIFDTKGRIIAFGGRVLGDEKTAKYLNSPETPIFKKSREIFGLYECLQANRNRPDAVVVVEGYMDAISLRQAGYNNVVATLGTALTSEHMQALFRYTNEVVFCFDSDEAGKKAGWHAMQVITPLLKETDKTVRFLFLPAGHDPDTFVRANGNAAFGEEVKKALSLTETLFLYKTKEFNLSHVGGRIEFIRNVASIIKAMPLNYQFVAKQLLCEILNMEASEVNTMVDDPSIEVAREFLPQPTYSSRRDDGSAPKQWNQNRPYQASNRGQDYGANRPNQGQAQNYGNPNQGFAGNGPNFGSPNPHYANQNQNYGNSPQSHANNSQSNVNNNQSFANQGQNYAPGNPNFAPGQPNFHGQNNHGLANGAYNGTGAYNGHAVHNGNGAYNGHAGHNGNGAPVQLNNNGMVDSRSWHNNTQGNDRVIRFEKPQNQFDYSNFKQAEGSSNQGNYQIDPYAQGGQNLSVEQFKDQLYMQNAQRVMQSPAGEFMQLGPNGAPSDDHLDDDYAGEYYEGGRGPQGNIQQRQEAWNNKWGPSEHLEQSMAATAAPHDTLNEAKRAGIVPIDFMEPIAKNKGLYSYEIANYRTLVRHDFTVRDATGPIYELLAFTLQQPTIVATLYDFLNLDEFLDLAKQLRLPEYPCIERLFELIKNERTITCALLIEEFRDTEFWSLFNYLFDMEIFKNKSDGVERSPEYKSEFFARFLFNSLREPYVERTEQVSMIQRRSFKRDDMVEMDALRQIADMKFTSQYNSAQG